MNIMELGAIGELVGGVAVIGSLIYVGFQIRQNTDSVRASAEFDSSRSFSDWLAQVAHSHDQARIFDRGVFDSDQLDENEKLRFVWAVGDLFSRIEGFYRLHRRGYLATEAYQPWEALMLAFLKRDLVMKWWRTGAIPYSGSFREYVDGLLRNEATTTTEFTPFADL